MLEHMDVSFVSLCKDFTPAFLPSPDGPGVEVDASAARALAFCGVAARGTLEAASLLYPTQLKLLDKRKSQIITEDPLSGCRTIVDSGTPGDPGDHWGCWQCLLGSHRRRRGRQWQFDDVGDVHSRGGIPSTSINGSIGFSEAISIPTGRGTLQSGYIAVLRPRWMFPDVRCHKVGADPQAGVAGPGLVWKRSFGQREDVTVITAHGLGVGVSVWVADTFWLV